MTQSLAGLGHRRRPSTLDELRGGGGGGWHVIGSGNGMGEGVVRLTRVSSGVSGGNGGGLIRDHGCTMYVNEVNQIEMLGLQLSDGFVDGLKDFLRIQ